MTDLNTTAESQVLDAVRDEMKRFGEIVSAEVGRLRAEAADERSSRLKLADQVVALAQAVEAQQTSAQQHSGSNDQVVKLVEDRLLDFDTSNRKRHDELSVRLGKVADEANNGVAAQTEAAMGPILKKVEHRQDQSDTSVATMQESLRKFDEQAARMVAHFAESVEMMQGRIEGISDNQADGLADRFGALEARVDDVSATATRLSAEVTTSVASQVDSAEDRVNDRMMSLEIRLGEEIGTKTAEIDAHVGRVSGGLDDAITVLTDRIAGADSKYGELEQSISSVREAIKSVDVDAIDEMNEKISGAAGEAMLVRIEMERLQESMTGTLDKQAVRLTEIETQMQESAMDTETAVQLERLEEVERALIMLDPNQFVRVDGSTSDTALYASESTQVADVEADAYVTIEPAAVEPVAIETVEPVAVEPAAPAPPAPTPAAPAPAPAAQAPAPAAPAPAPAPAAPTSSVPAAPLHDLAIDLDLPDLDLSGGASIPPAPTLPTNAVHAEPLAPPAQAQQ